jgi:membrane protein DedA with SNARE-associated domain
MESLSSWIEQGVTHLLGGLEQSGYLGIFLLMAIESSFIPFPSEVVMLPAGAMAANGKFQLPLVILSGTAGSLVGALFNYFFARYLGIGFLERYGKYFLVSHAKIVQAQRAWEKHGELTTFVCRLLPGIRQLISLPAGLAKMPLGRFCFWTGLGAGMWVTILALTGFYFGNQAVEYWDQHKGKIVAAIIACCAVVVVVYVFLRLRKPVSQVAE